MEIGIVGKPNAGKSTFFSALTEVPVEIASYPFTTIEPNRGVGYIPIKCPHIDVSDHCNPRAGYCKNGIRYVPVEIIDVAGLVPGAHEGKGLGNKFLDDLRKADGLIHVIDLSGSSSLTGEIKSPGTYDPDKEVQYLIDELAYWVEGIIERGWKRSSRGIALEGKKIEDFIAEKVAGLGISREEVISALRESSVDLNNIDNWSKEMFFIFSRTLLEKSKPIIIAGNKADISSEKNIDFIKSKYGNKVVITSGDYELTLKKAAKHNLIDYSAGASVFQYVKEMNPSQKMALEKIEKYLGIHKSTGIEKALTKLVFDLLHYVVIFPVQDEGKYTDGSGNILPDAILVKQGATPRDIAYKVHTDLGDNFIKAINAKTGMVIGHNYTATMGDVIKIVSKN
ncbi:MAG: redox-regulated ATPase YchF [Candidatus Thermoplasmatota archaeon]|nr:redox-regulated ATPase YchF [Candidatus Thermoplasmatota archaeon]MCL5962923.1 redox-regulated ATPase YchF [Candidatus Thermoplasmatota archaeon]